MTVTQIQDKTGQKRGTIEQFRTILQNYRLLKNNESMDDREVRIFEKSIQYKDESENTWIDCMHKAIQEEYGEEIEFPFEWDKEIILKNLLWEIKNKPLKIVQMATDIFKNDLEYHIIIEVIIENFKKLGSRFDCYKGSNGTDGNPATTFKCIGDNYFYYLVGKCNNITKNEDIHVFYNEGNSFNIMKCKYICGGDSNKGYISDLWNICCGQAVKSL